MLVPVEIRPVLKAKGVFADEIGIIEFFSHNDVGDSESQGAVSSGLDGYPLICFSCSDGKSGVDLYKLCPAIWSIAAHCTKCAYLPDCGTRGF